MSNTFDPVDLRWVADALGTLREAGFAPDGIEADDGKVKFVFDPSEWGKDDDSEGRR